MTKVIINESTDPPRATCTASASRTPRSNSNHERRPSPPNRWSSRGGQSKRNRRRRRRLNRPKRPSLKHRGFKNRKNVEMPPQPVSTLTRKHESQAWCTLGWDPRWPQRWLCANHFGSQEARQAPAGDLPRRICFGFGRRRRHGGGVGWGSKPDKTGAYRL